MLEIPASPQVENGQLIGQLRKQIEDLNGALEELDLLVQPQGSVLRFLELRGFQKVKGVGV